VKSRVVELEIIAVVNKCVGNICFSSFRSILIMLWGIGA
jgi:hypothetical protein